MAKYMRVCVLCVLCVYVYGIGFVMVACNMGL